MLETIVKGNSRSVEFKDESVIINGQEFPLDLVKVREGKYLHLMHNNHSYVFELIAFDKESKTYKLGFDGRTYEVEIKDRFDQLLHNMGLDKVNKAKVNEVKAPMPGLVLKVKTAEGDEVKKGDPLLILEAMKMENVIKSPSDGTIKQILVREKEAVDKGQTLIQFN